MKQKAPCFLALDCSLMEGSLTLMEIRDQELSCLAFKKWTSRRNKKRVENSHSERLPLEIHQALKKARKKLSCLEFLAVGAGPGLWTGVRTAVNVIRSLAFCLDIPVYAVNSLRLAGEPFLFPKEPTAPATQDPVLLQTDSFSTEHTEKRVWPHTQATISSSLTARDKPGEFVFIAFNGFKNQVHYAEFFSKKEREGNVSLLPFEKWQKKNDQTSQRVQTKKTGLCL